MSSVPGGASVGGSELKSGNIRIGVGDGNGNGDVGVGRRFNSAFHAMNVFTLADVNRPITGTPRIDMILTTLLFSCMVAFTAYLVITDQNVPNIDTTTAVADVAPDWRIFNVAVSNPDMANLALFDYSSVECNASLAAIRVGVDPAEGGLGYFGHTSRTFQEPSINISKPVYFNGDLSFTTSAMNMYFQPVPSPFHTYTDRPNYQSLDDPNNAFGTANYCFGDPDPNSGVSYYPPSSVSYCYNGNPWLANYSVAPTNYYDGLWVNAFDLNGGRAPNKPYENEPAIGGFRQCESQGNTVYSQYNVLNATITVNLGGPPLILSQGKVEQGATAEQFRHVRYGVVPLCYLTRLEQETSCISDPNGQIIDTTNDQNRCKERGIYRFGMAYQRSVWARNSDNRSPQQDQFQNNLEIGFSFLDSQTLNIFDSAISLDSSAAYYFTYQLTQVTDYTQSQPTLITDIDTLCSYQSASSDSTTQRDAASQTRILTLMSVEKRSPLDPNIYTIGNVEDFVYVYIGITPIWFHREIKSGRIGTLAILAQLGGALTSVFTMLKVLRMLLKFVHDVLLFQWRSGHPLDERPEAKRTGDTETAHLKRRERKQMEGATFNISAEGQPRKKSQLPTRRPSNSAVIFFHTDEEKTGELDDNRVQG